MRLAAAALGLFVVTAVLVAAGALTGVDQYAVSHLMPWLEPRRHPAVTVAALTLPDWVGSPANRLVDLWTYPASFVPSALLVLVCARVLRGRGEPGAAVTWCALWVAGNAIELAGKTLVERPALYRGAVHVEGFDHSLPSGHTIRSLLVAAALAATWRRGRLAYLWAAGVAVALVPLGAHTPTDIAAGALVALALVLAASFGRQWRLGP